MTTFPRRFQNLFEGQDYSSSSRLYICYNDYSKTKGTVVFRQNRFQWEVFQQIYWVIRKFEFISTGNTPPLIKCFSFLSQGQREHDSGLTSSGQSQWLLLWRPGGEKSAGHDVSCRGGRLPVWLVSFPNRGGDSLWLIWFKIKNLKIYGRWLKVLNTYSFIMTLDELC